MIYTSGTTGRPKGCPNSHRGVSNRLNWMQETFRLGAGDRCCRRPRTASTSRSGSSSGRCWPARRWSSPARTAPRQRPIWPAGRPGGGDGAALRAVDAPAVPRRAGRPRCAALAAGDLQRRGAAAASCAAFQRGCRGSSCTTSTARPRRPSTSRTGRAGRLVRAPTCRSAGRSTTPSSTSSTPACARCRRGARARSASAVPPSASATTGGPMTKRSASCCPRPRGQRGGAAVPHRRSGTGRRRRRPATISGVRTTSSRSAGCGWRRVRSRPRCSRRRAWPMPGCCPGGDRAGDDRSWRPYAWRRATVRRRCRWRSSGPSWPVRCPPI